MSMQGENIRGSLMAMLGVPWRLGFSDKDVMTNRHIIEEKLQNKQQYSLIHFSVNKTCHSLNLTTKSH